MISTLSLNSLEKTEAEKRNGKEMDRFALSWNCTKFENIIPGRREKKEEVNEKKKRNN